MSIRRLIASSTAAFLRPLGRVLLLSIYYLAIIAALIFLYGKGNLTPTDFVYQGF
jgi:hypothetical protein